MTHLIIKDQFGIQNLHMSPIFLVGTFFAASYSKTALDRLIKHAKVMLQINVYIVLFYKLSIFEVTALCMLCIALITPPIAEIIWVKNVRPIVVCGFLMK